MIEIRKIIQFKSHFVEQVEIQLGRKLDNFELVDAKKILLKEIKNTVANTAILVADKLKV